MCFLRLARTTEEAAFDLIMAASEMAVEPWDEVYKMAHKQKALKNGAPTRPLRLVSRVVSTQVDNFADRVNEGIKELELVA